MENILYNELCEAIGKDRVKQEEPMSQHTTFKVGGNAEYFVAPDSIEGIKAVVEVCKKHKVPYYVCGNGSNLLVSDEGFRGVILQIFHNLNECKMEKGKITVQAGMLLTKVAKLISQDGYTGMEFAIGIPGTIGGAVAMNAGAYGGEIKDVITKATVLNKEGQVLTLNKEELELGYRTSIITREEYIVLEAEFELEQGKQEEIKALCEKNSKARIEKQPLEFPSAGSTFKRPEGYFAGKLIMDAGLRGYTIGGAQVSEKHCGFIINKGNAKAKDVLDLIQYVQKKVMEEYQVTLETEVKMLGF